MILSFSHTLHILVLYLLFCSILVSSSSITIYLSPSGNDSNPGNHENKILTLQRALQIYSNKTKVTLNFESGIYPFQNPTTWLDLDSLDFQTDDDPAIFLHNESSSFLTFSNISLLSMVNMHFQKDPEQVCFETNEGGFISLNNCPSSTFSFSKFLYGCANGGGGLYAFNSTVEFHNLNATFNEGHFGGAIFTSNSILKMYDSILSNNFATEGKGGALYLTNSAFLINNTQFISNGASYYLGGAGGALAFVGDSSFNTSFQSQIINSLFETNVGGLGGAIALYGLNTIPENITLTNVSFQYNQALVSGAAIHLDKSGGTTPSVNISVIQSEFICNTDKGEHFAPIRAYDMLDTHLLATIFLENSTVSILSCGAILCDAGLEIGPQGDFYCVPCQPGYYSKVLQKTCSACDIGSVAPSYGMSSCTPCKPGNYSGIPAGTVCNICPPYYWSQLGSSNCPDLKIDLSINSLTGNDQNNGSSLFPLQTLTNATIKVATIYNSFTITPPSPPNFVNVTLSLSNSFFDGNSINSNLSFDHPISQLSIVSEISGTPINIFLSLPFPLFYLDKVSSALFSDLNISFIGHQTSNESRALNLFNGDFSVHNSIFSNFVCSGNGGAIHILNSNLTIYSSTFLNNTSIFGSGGGIFFSGLGGTPPQLVIDSSHFFNNSGFDGSHIFADSLSYTGSNNIFLNLEFEPIIPSGERGGALSLSNSQTAFSSSSQFINVSSSYGGAIYLSNSSMIFDNCTFEMTGAFEGTSIFLDESYINIQKSSFHCSFLLNNSIEPLIGIPPIQSISSPTGAFVQSDQSQFTQVGCPWSSLFECPPCQGISPDSLFCQHCLDGQESNTSYCVDCHSGFWSVGGNPCQPCPAGWRSISARSTSCIKCPQNFYQPNSGQSNCLQCPSDQISQPGSALCVDPNSKSNSTTSASKSDDNEFKTGFYVVLSILSFLGVSALVAFYYHQKRTSTRRYLRVKDETDGGISINDDDLSE